MYKVINKQILVAFSVLFLCKHAVMLNLRRYRAFMRIMILLCEAIAKVQTPLHLNSFLNIIAGGFPYPMIPNGELLEHLKRGHRLEPPQNCSREM